MKIICIVSILVVLLTDVYVPIYIKRFKNARFSDQRIMADENVQSIAKTHWIVIAKMIVVQLIISLLCIWLFIMGDIGIVGQGWIPFICTIAIMCWLLVVLRKQVLYWCQEFVVTNKRVIYRVASVHEFPIEKIESCQIAHGHIGKLLGYSSVLLYGAGGNLDAVRFIDTRSAILFQHSLMTTIAGERQTRSFDFSKNQELSYKSSIEELQSYKKLLDDGVITMEEFEKKKERILSR